MKCDYTYDDPQDRENDLAREGYVYNFTVTGSYEECESVKDWCISTFTPAAWKTGSGSISIGPATLISNIEHFRYFILKEKRDAAIFRIFWG